MPLRPAAVPDALLAKRQAGSTPASASRRVGLIGLGAWLCLQGSRPAWAQATAKGKVLLTISGRLDRANAAGRADFDLAMLDALPQHSYVTGTPWFKQPRKFSGPLLRDLLAAVGGRGETLVAVALNDYKVEIPIDDVRRYPVMLATRLDDEPMRVRDKGPLFIIYPFDANADLRSERYYSRAAWQLRHLELR